MVSMIDSVIQKSRVYLTGMANWKKQVHLHIDCGPYQLQVAESKSQVIDCFRLRHEVFCEELAGRRNSTGLDYDEYDALCDHLIIVHGPTQKIVGTYRINFSDSSEKFYTESEFEISGWLKSQRSSFIELGRACIQQDHRRGAVISLLWRGIIEYMKASQAKTLLGCSSIKGTNSRAAAMVFKYFEINGYLADQLYAPVESYQMKDFLFWMMVFSNGLNQQQILEVEEKIPPLLRAYIKAGAKIASYPAVDHAFNCVDFMTVLHRDELDQKLARKFQA